MLREAIFPAEQEAGVVHAGEEGGRSLSKH
jgi:hypothetical protein